MAKYCLRCGKKNPENASVCGECAAPFADSLMWNRNPGSAQNILQDEDNKFQEREPSVQPEIKFADESLKNFNFSAEEFHQTNQLLDSKKITEIKSGREFFFVLSDVTGFSSTEYKVLNSIHNTGLLRCKRFKYNGKTALFYCPGSYRSLDILIPTLDVNGFLSILENIINRILDIRENGFLTDVGLDVRINKIYIDTMDGKVYLTYLPINDRCYPDGMYLENKLRKDLAYIIRSVFDSYSSNIMNLAQMMEEPSCSLDYLLSAIRQNRSVSSNYG